MFLSSAPEKFNPKFEVVSIFLECNEKILFLQRLDHKPQGGTWGVPAGKIDAGETPLLAILRELIQETGFSAKENLLTYFRKFYVRYPEYDFIYHVFSLKLNEMPHIKINPGEHKSFQWLTPTEALEINLIQDEDASIKAFYRI
jgi:8-oxo-dGTP pyrophosphatase MutT (NUDIX family)